MESRVFVPELGHSCKALAMSVLAMFFSPARYSSRTDSNLGRQAVDIHPPAGTLTRAFSESSHFSNCGAKILFSVRKNLFTRGSNADAIATAYQVQEGAPAKPSEPTHSRCKPGQVHTIPGERAAQCWQCPLTFSQPATLTWTLHLSRPSITLPPANFCSAPKSLPMPLLL